MKTSIDDQRLDEALRRANPCPTRSAGTALDEDAEQAFRRIVASPVAVRPTGVPRSPESGIRGVRAMRPAGSRVFALAAAVAVVAIAFAFVAGSGSFARTSTKAYAATPPLLAIHPLASETAVPPAGPALRALADLADQQPWSPGRFLYTSYRSWSLNVAAGGGSVATAVVPSTTEVWRAADDSGRLKVTSDPAESGSGENDTDRQAASATPADIDTEDTAHYFRDDPAVSALSTTSPDLLQSQLLGSGDVPPQGAIPTYLTMLSQYEQYQPLPPALQANLWRLLADSGSFVDLGTTTDRAGRLGDAIAYDTSAPTGAILPTRFLLVIDPQTGLLLDSERILTSDPGMLPVHIPAVVDYTVFLAAGKTSSDHAMP